MHWSTELNDKSVLMVITKLVVKTIVITKLVIKTIVITKLVIKTIVVTKLVITIAKDNR